MTEARDCAWPGNDPEMLRYHDEEWGVPLTDSRDLFDKFMLDAFQAGLSWRTVLHKRTALRAAFAGFDPEVLATWTPDDVAAALDSPNIIRNRAKARAAVTNARAWVQIEAEVGFAKFLWQHVDQLPLNPRAKSVDDIATQDDRSRQLSKSLKACGFSFCGPVMVMAFMEAVGMRNHHVVGCSQHEKCSEMAKSVSTKII